jgi:hypothetical protein
VTESPGHGAVTLRELYQQTESVRITLESKLDTVSTRLDAALSKHEGEHDLHEQRHEREHDKRVSLVRWAVSTIVALGAIAVSATAVLITIR